MAIPGKETIRIGTENSVANSDSLYTAFTKTQNNFNRLFSLASSYTNIVGGTGINTVASNSSVTITNTGVLNIIAGTNIAVDRANGNVVISAIAGSNGNSGVTSVGITSSTLTVSNTPIVSSGNIIVNLPQQPNVIPGTYVYPTLTIDAQGRVIQADSAESIGTVSSVAIAGGVGMQVTGSPITSNGTITITNTGVTRINAGYGIALSDNTGNLTISLASPNVAAGGGTATPAGSTGAVQYNNGGSLGADATFSYDADNNILSVDSIDVSYIDVGNIVCSDDIDANSANISANAVLTDNLLLANGDPWPIAGIYSNSNVESYLPTYMPTYLSTYTGNVTANNATLSNVTASYFIGAGNNLSNIQGTNVSGAVANATYANNANIANTVTASAQPNIRSVGNLISLNVAGEAVVGGNLTVGGTLVYSNVTSLYVEDTLIDVGGGPNGDPLVSNDGKDRGLLLHYYTSEPVDAFMGWDNSNAEFTFGSNVSNSAGIITYNSLGNVRAGNAILGNLVQSNNFAGNLLGNVINGNSNIRVSANGNIAISSGGVANTLVVSNTAVVITGNAVVSANLTASNATLGNLTTSNYFAGVLTTAAQPNITSVGSLIGLTVSNATGIVNFTNTANVSLGSVSNLKITGGSASQYLQTDGAGNLSWVSVSTSSSLANGNSNVSIPVANGNVTISAVGNTVMTITGTGANITGTANISGNLSAGNVSVTANITAGNASVSNVTATANVTAGNLKTDNLLYANGVAWNLAGAYSNTNVAAYLPTYTGNITSGNASLGNIALANYFSGNGSLLTAIQAAQVNGTVANATYAINAGTAYSISGANVSGNVANANFANFAGTAFSVSGGAVSGTVASALTATTAGTVTTAAQPNITSVGTLSSLVISGNLTSNNANLGNLAKANYFQGDGSLLTNLAGGALISNGTSNVRTLSTGAVLLSAGGTANVLSVASTGANVTGILRVNSNAIVGNILTDGYYYSNGVPVTLGGGGSTPTRNVANVYSDPIGNGSSATVSFTGWKSYVLLKSYVSHACWVTMYTDEASRLADSSRTIGTDPTAGSGVVAEFITTGANTVLFTPGTIGWNNEATPNTAIPVRITNLSGGPANILLSSTILQMET